MSNSQAGPGSGTTPPPHEPRLESWGEIAAYLRRDIRTVQRWERTLGLPVRRLQVGKQSSVYAYRSELDRWYRQREPNLKKEELNSQDPQSPVPGEPDPPTKEPLEENALQENRKFTRTALLATAVGGAILALSVILAVAAGWLPNPFVKPRTEKIRLFVRPFADSSSPNQAAFAEGLTDEVTTQISRLDPGHLGVIAPTTAKVLKDKSISDLDQTLRVQYVLEGSVRSFGNQVRIDVHLILSKDQTPIWSESYTDTLSDILLVQDNVSSAVASRILAKLPDSAKPALPGSVDPAAYQSFLMGRRYLAVRNVPASIDAFEKALPKLSDYPPAHAGLASAYALLGEAPYDVVAATVSAPKARAEAERAIRLDPRNAEAHCVLAHILLDYDWDFLGAEREFRQALSLEPNNATVHQWFSQYLMVMGRLPEADAEASRALEFDPLSPIFATTRAEARYYARDFDAAIADSNLTLQSSPNFAVAEFWLGSVYREKKMFPDSLSHFRRARQILPPNSALLMAYGHALAVSGDSVGAQSALRQLQTLAANSYVPAIYFAGLYTGMGKKEEAFLWLDKAVTEHDERLIYLKVDPIADPLRSDRRFQQLLAKIHLR